MIVFSRCWVMPSINDYLLDYATRQHGSQQFEDELKESWDWNPVAATRTSYEQRKRYCTCNPYSGVTSQDCAVHGKGM